MPTVTPIAPTSRNIGLKGKLSVGTTAGGTDKFNSATLKGLRFRVNGEVIDVSSNQDVFKQYAEGQISMTVSVEKLIAGSAEFVAMILDAPTSGRTFYLEPFLGAAGTPAAGTGASLSQFVGILNEVEYSGAEKEAMENLSFQISGAPVS